MTEESRLHRIGHNPAGLQSGHQTVRNNKHEGVSRASMLIWPSFDSSGELKRSGSGTPHPNKSQTNKI